MTLSGKTYVVTGAAAGLGRELARKLCEHNADLLLVDKDADGLTETANQLNSTKIELVVFDLKDTPLLEKTFSEIFEKKKETLFGLINCASCEYDGFYDDIPMEIMRENNEVNLWAPIILSRMIAPILKGKRNGQIINVISDMSYRSVGGRLAYCMSKSAMKSFSECIRMELKSYNVDGISIFPGTMSTGFWKSVVTYGRMRPQIPDPRKQQTAAQVADFVFPKILRRKLVIRQFGLIKLFLFFDAVFPIMGDMVIEKGLGLKEANL